jgi:poly-beta-1,6-N-acetyl-D-glucosamine synthase
VSHKPIESSSERSSSTQSTSEESQKDQLSAINDHRSPLGALYSLVTPVYNEEAQIGRTIDAVVKQSILPIEWIIVSDGSTDRTDEIIANASQEHPWIKLLRVEDNPGVGFARVVLNTEHGISELQNQSYKYLGLLDADVTFQQDYFEALLQRFDDDPNLGLAGGVVIDVGLPRDQFPLNRIDVPGAVQFFRRTCFESLGGLIPIPEGGWDGMTCARARMNGYQTRLLTDLVVDHHKPRNISQGGLLQRKYQMGVRDYAVGYHPLFEFLKCFSRITRERPFLFAVIAWGCGYTVASIQRRKRIVPDSLLKYLRREQLNRIFRRRSVS